MSTHCIPLQVTSITNTGTIVNITINPTTLVAGQYAFLDINGIAMAAKVTNGEFVTITNGTDTIPLGFREAIPLLSRDLFARKRFCLKYIASSIVGVPTSTALPAFIVID